MFSTHSSKPVFAFSVRCELERCAVTELHETSGDASPRATETCKRVSFSLVCRYPTPTLTPVFVTQETTRTRYGALCVLTNLDHKRTRTDKPILAYIEESMKLRRAQQATDSNSRRDLRWECAGGPLQRSRSSTQRSSVSLAEEEHYQRAVDAHRYSRGRSRHYGYIAVADYRRHVNSQAHGHSREHEQPADEDSLVMTRCTLSFSSKYVV
ncbi:hypothetical protein V8E53_011974 [Lactarius tabidus]